MTLNRCLRQAQSCFSVETYNQACRNPRPVFDPARLHPTLQRITRPVKKILGQDGGGLMPNKITFVL